MPNPISNTFEDTFNLFHSILQLPKLDLLNQGKATPETNPLLPFHGVNQEGKEDAGNTKDPEMTKQQIVKDQRETPPLPERRPDDFGTAIAPPSVGGQKGMNLPSGVVGDNPAMKAALGQMALNMLTPSWGGPLANLGMALGHGAQAYTRVKQSGQKDVDRALATAKGEADVDATKALAEARRAAAETSKEKRLTQKTKRSTEFERLTESLDIGPKGRLYLKEALKTLDNEDVLADEPKTVEQRYNDMITTARQLDGQVLPNTTTASKDGTVTSGYPDGYVYTREDGAQLRYKQSDPNDPNDWQNQDNWTVIKEAPKQKAK